MKLFLTSHRLEERHVTAFKQLLVGSEQVGRALFITAAAVPYGTDPRPTWVEESFAPLRPLAKHVDETDCEAGSLLPDKLSNYDFIFMSGGNSFYLAYRLAESGLGEKLKKYIQDGGIYAGSSAGSIILMDSIEHFKDADDPRKAPKIYPGLGVIRQAIIPHADSPKYAPLMSSIAEKYQEEGYETILLNDDQALLIADKEHRVV